MRTRRIVILSPQFFTHPYIIKQETRNNQKPIIIDSKIEPKRNPNPKLLFIKSGSQEREEDSNIEKSVNARVGRKSFEEENRQPPPPSSKLKPASRRRIETEDIRGGRGAEAWNDFAANNNRGRKVDA